MAIAESANEHADLAIEIADLGDDWVVGADKSSFSIGLRIHLVIQTSVYFGELLPPLKDAQNFLALAIAF